jgi:hypothetical protein
VVLGLDKDATPHAARFEQADTVLAKKAAEINGLRMITVEDPALVLLTASLPKGRVLRGNAIVPVVAADVYAKLTALIPPDGPEVARSGTSAQNLRAAPRTHTRPRTSRPSSGTKCPLATPYWATSAESKVGGR